MLYAFASGRHESWIKLNSSFEILLFQLRGVLLIQEHYSIYANSKTYHIVVNLAVFMAFSIHLYCKFVYANGRIRSYIAGSMSNKVGDAMSFFLPFYPSILHVVSISTGIMYWLKDIGIIFPICSFERDLECKGKPIGCLLFYAVAVTISCEVIWVWSRKSWRNVNCWSNSANYSTVHKFFNISVRVVCVYFTEKLLVICV